MNRDNGQPLANTQVQAYENKYNYKTSKDEDIKAESYTTDKNGLFKLKQTTDYRNIIFQMKYNNDELFMDDNEGYRSYNSYNTMKHQNQNHLLFYLQIEVFTALGKPYILKAL